MNKVFIIGGGVAGLTAAHELSERGFDITIFEKEKICGGKARSMAFEGSGTNGNADLPGEHGFRFFPGFYWHTSDTMKRIWIDRTANKRVIDNFVAGEKIGIGQIGKPLFLVEANPPRNLFEWIEAFDEIFANPSLGVPRTEARVFVRKLLCFLGAGPSRRLELYEGQSWWNFTEAQNKSDAYKNVLVGGLSRSLVAMKPHSASTLTVATMLVQILVNIVDPPGPDSNADRVLNGPTSEAWINPWVTQLQGNSPPVTIHNSCPATALKFDAATKKITGVTVNSAVNGVQQFGDSSDFYIAAVPVEVVQSDETLFPPELKAAARLTWFSPLGIPMGVNHLTTDWMTGVLFYLNRQATALKGHIVHATSSWALTSITQAQFWTGYPWNTKGNGQTRDILSAIISDWDRTSPRNGKTAKQCTKQEIFTESWEQLKEHLANESLPGKISDSDRVLDAGQVTQFLDPAITFDSAGIVHGNSAPLLVNVVHSRQHRPVATTQLTNFFVAADYVKTNTDLACMEAANEAARAGVNGVLDASGSTKARCDVRKLHEPPLFEWFQGKDEEGYPGNRALEPFLCRYLDQLLADPNTFINSLQDEIMTLAPTAGAAPPAVPWWVWTLVALGVVDAVLLLIILLQLAGS